MLFVEFSLYLASRFVGKFERKGVCEIGVNEGLNEVKEFQVVIRMCQMKRLLDHLLNLIRLEEKHVLPNKGVVL